VDIPLSAGQALSTWQRRKPTCLLKHKACGFSTTILKICSEASLLACLLGRHECLGSLLTDQLDTWLGSTADAQERDLLGLANDAKARVIAAGIALPVRVSSDISSRKGDGIGILERIIAARCWVAEIRVERNAGRAVGINGKSTTDALP